MTTKRLLAFVLALCIAILFLPTAAGVDALNVSARCAVLVDAQSGRILYEKNPLDPMLIASTTKTMTALVVLRNCDLDDVVTVAGAQTGVEGSSMFLRPGERVTVRALLCGLLILSGNDAAEALAIHCAGSIPAFAGMMNATARELNLLRSHFANPHGLNANNHYSCARDLAVIFREALNIEAFREIISTEEIEIAGRTMQSHNQLLREYEGAIGGKTGYTMKAGRCLVSAAERGGRMLIAVTLNAPEMWEDQTALYDDGFARYTSRTLCEAGEEMGRVPVFSGTESDVPVLAMETLTLPLTDEEYARAELSVSLPWYMEAPVQEGARAGYARWLLDGRLIGQVELCFAGDVPMVVEGSSFWRGLGDFFIRNA